MEFYSTNWILWIESEWGDLLNKTEKRFLAHAINCNKFTQFLNEIDRSWEGDIYSTQGGVFSSLTAKILWVCMWKYLLHPQHIFFYPSSTVLHKSLLALFMRIGLYVVPGISWKARFTRINRRGWLCIKWFEWQPGNNDNTEGK